MLRRAEVDLAADGAAPPPPLETEAELRDEDDAIERATSAERKRLVMLRDNGTIGDAAFQRLEQELDLEELHLERLGSGGGRSEA
jgi:CPA1 family monovalent cation:H+ antiporter